MALTDATKELRAPPYPLERLAKIPLRQDSCCCLVADIPGGGVRIKILGFDIPEEFELFFYGKGTAQNGTYRMIWRREGEIGATFVGPKTIQSNMAQADSISLPRGARFRV